MKKYFFLGAALIFIFFAEKSTANIYINEIMADNVLSCPDDHGEYEDWIELYNSADQPVDIGGYYLADDPLQKWKIPLGTIMEAKGYIVFIADGKPGLFHHASFNLNKDGERLYLFSSDGITLIDYINFPEQLRDVSYGRWQDGGATWNYMHVISPAKINKPGYAGFTKPPHIIQSSGFYTDNIIITIQPSAAGDIIRYTLDGSDPEESSQEYNSYLEINKSCVIKARAFRNGYLAGEISVRSVFINEHPSLPVLSLITDPKNLYDPVTGIYNHDFDGRAWERFCELDYLPASVSGFNIPAGIRIQGNTGPMDYSKKSFRIFLRKGYGQDELIYPLFDHDRFNSNIKLVLRAGYDDCLEPGAFGTNAAGTLIRDPLITELWRRTGQLIPLSKLSSLYINGSFHGIYDIKQSVDEVFIKTRTGYKDPDIMRTRWDSTELVYGSRTKWNELLAFFQNNTFESDAMLAEAAKRLDLDNYITLQAFVHLAQYASWGYGVFMFRENSDDGKWRFTLWDADRAFTNAAWNGFNGPLNPVGYTLTNTITKKLLQNKSFRENYINRTADYLNGLFSMQEITLLIDSLSNVIRNEIPAEAAKWNTTVEKWEQNIADLKSFTQQRPEIVRNYFADQFSLTGCSALTLEIVNSGKIKVNSVTPDHYPWNGKYFNGIPVTLKAAASKGYIFTGWDDPSLPPRDSIIITLDYDRTVKAIFKKLEDSNLEMIVPASVPLNHDLPVIVRVRDKEGNIDAVNQDPVLLFAEGAVQDTSIKIKRGAGSGSLNVKSTSGFILNAVSGNSASAQKKISISNTPDQYYSGLLPAGEVIWDNSAIIHINNHLTIPAGTTLKIKEGAWILISKNTNVYVRGKIIVEGSINAPVVITSESADAWGGFEFTAAIAEFHYCFITNGGGDPSRGNPTSDGWHTGKQHIFFGKDNSVFNFDNCFFLNSPGKVFGAQDSRVNVNNSVTSYVWHGGEFHRVLLNYKNSHLMNLPNDDHIYLEDIDTDGFHIDWVNSKYPQFSVIENCYFVTGKDDAIDHHAARLKIINCWLEDFTHEGVAASGGDTVIIFNTVALKNDQGFEAGWTETNVSKGPIVIIDHCTAVDNNVGLRIGDSYAWSYRDYMKVTNTVLYNNKDNIRNHLNSTNAPLAGAIDISFSMTNDEEYNNTPHSITGIPEFDENYYLSAGSPGSISGTRGTNMGRADSASVNKGMIVINEIMYNERADMSTGDWIEIYNPHNLDRDISGWKLKDNSNIHTFIIPAGSIIPSNSFLVLCADTSSFRTYHSGMPVIGNFSFGFGSDDQVRLLDHSGLLMDSMAYSGSAPWDQLADGKGYSLELINPAESHTDYWNWSGSYIYGGTPGSVNQRTGTRVSHNGQLFNYYLYQNYPNPFNPSTTIRYDLPGTEHVDLKIYDILGREVFTLVDEVQDKGPHTGTFETGGLSSGIYVYRIEAGKFVMVRKMILLK